MPLHDDDIVFTQEAKLAKLEKKFRELCNSARKHREKQIMDGLEKQIFGGLRNKKSLEQMVEMLLLKHKGKPIIRHHSNPKWKKYRERLLYA